MKTDLGIAFIPGTFPTFIVQDAIMRALPESRFEWSRSKVNDLYYLYEAGIKKGFPVVRPQEFDVKKYMMENSAFSENDIRVFLMILYELAQSGEIEQKWWNIDLQKSQSIIPGLNTNIIEKTTSAIKWGSIALLAVGAIYISWPILKKMRRKSNG